jgi:hypothetical protein
VFLAGLAGAPGARAACGGCSAPALAFHGPHTPPSLTSAESLRIQSRSQRGPTRWPVPDRVVLRPIQASVRRWCSDRLFRRGAPGQASVWTSRAKSDFDPAFIADGKRTWFFFSAGRWNRYPLSGREAGIRRARLVPDLRAGRRLGKDLVEPTAIARGVGAGATVRLTTGELLLPTYDFGDAQPGCWSADSSKTWQVQGRLTTPAGAD